QPYRVPEGPGCRRLACARAMRGRFRGISGEPEDACGKHAHTPSFGLSFQTSLSRGIAMKSRSFSGVPCFTGIAILSSSLLGSPIAWAEETTVLKELVITAAGREQALADVQASVEVIDRKAIERYSGASVTEILRFAAGIDARTSGPNESVSIRGQKSNGTLILFDGMPRTGTYGSTNLNNFPLEEVER